MRILAGPAPDMVIGARWHPASGNRLEIIGHVWAFEQGQKRLLCQVRCQCGTEFSVRPEHLRSGNTQSCGCLHKERSAERLRQMWRQYRLNIPAEERDRCL